MCGRSKQALATAAMQDLAARHVPTTRDQPWVKRECYSPKFNLCPGHDAAVVRQACSAKDTAALHTMRWGLVTASSTDTKPDHWRMFNARCETVDSLGVFSRLLRQQRCAVPVDGFFEWTADEYKEVKTKQPYYVHQKNNEPLWLAGLYDVRPGLEGIEGPLETFTLLTRNVAQRLAWLHDRQPVLLDATGLQSWLAAPDVTGVGHDHLPMTTIRRCATLLSEELHWHPVSKKMSKLDYQGHDTAEPVTLASCKQPSVLALFGRNKQAAVSGQASCSTTKQTNMTEAMHSQQHLANTACNGTVAVAKRQADLARAGSEEPAKKKSKVVTQFLPSSNP
mmetsp:Transcript_11856/g.19977  ORF Transcript_11856/g.19977 Transcript_11856/m.19977 type:complete len:337 (-) Transcript_11856:317-1327(-)|eukprot:CAMPEP_0119326604 /NCGR_PEP_ID=MMETSP1333-20130426/68779_1 /TAXON_ID=418940 /ORGANISM="Scyphosphaera apsteinii, Strain RCC1455" /LENGTH=336 /DNA_ID=CAMNT_0007334951 /DNA_START=143 /DNA_END=1153 /DNA_ORIENTATION=+